MAEREAYRPAQLTADQLERLRRLERELGVVLVAYAQDEASAPAAHRPEDRHGTGRERESGLGESFRGRA